MTDIVCSCCGGALRDNGRENVWHGEVPYPGDLGTGLCRDCGGDPDAKCPRKRLGFAVCCFVDARIPRVAEALSYWNRVHFLALTYEEQAEIILRLVARGVLA